MPKVTDQGVKKGLPFKTKDRTEVITGQGNQ
jgi:hypothetical protein